MTIKSECSKITSKGVQSKMTIDSECSKITSKGVQPRMTIQSECSKITSKPMSHHTQHRSLAIYLTFIQI